MNVLSISTEERGKKKKNIIQKKTIGPKKGISIHHQETQFSYPVLSLYTILFSVPSSSF